MIKEYKEVLRGFAVETGGKVITDNKISFEICCPKWKTIFVNFKTGTLFFTSESLTFSKDFNTIEELKTILNDIK